MRSLLLWLSLCIWLAVSVVVASERQLDDLNSAPIKKKKKKKKAGRAGSLARWGSPFNTGSLQGDNVIRDCVLPQSGAKVCCYALNASTTYQQDVLSQPHERGLGFQRAEGDMIGKDGPATNAARTDCTLAKIYHPSSYETKQMEMVYRIHNISASKERFEALREAFNSNEMITDSTIWTKRITDHMMASDFVSSKSDVDKLYLSRFHMKATCDDGHIEEWDEFIEPLTIHTRHPFGFEQCPKGILNEEKTKTKTLSITNVDYVLLQPGKGLQKQRSYVKTYPRNYMLDAGSVCMYEHMCVCIYQNMCICTYEHMCMCMHSYPFSHSFYLPTNRPFFNSLF